MQFNRFALSFVAILMSFYLLSCYQPIAYEAPYIDLDFASTESISTFTGYSQIKLAYTKKIAGIRWVHFVDFNKPTLAPEKLKKPAGKDNVHADSPILSPDGKYVTYHLLTGLIESGAYVQYLDAGSLPVLVSATGTEPHWWEDSTGQTYIVYSTRFQTDLLTTGIGKTYRSKITFASNVPSVGAPEEIAEYPMNGGLSKDGKYLCTGYKYAAFYETESSNLVMINAGFQTCNPSIIPDETITDQMMFLNIEGTQNLLGSFASDPTYPATGGIINNHKVIFIVDKSNTVKNFIPVSDGYGEWQDPEWSNVPELSTAIGLTSGEAGTGDAVIIKLSTKEKLVVSQGNYKFDNTATPYFWFKN